MESNKTLIPLVKAVELATGNRPHKSTVIRWVVKGVLGVHLEAKRLGSRYMTTIEDVHRFIEQTTQSSKPQIQLSTPLGLRLKTIETAKIDYDRLKPRRSKRQAK